MVYRDKMPSMAELRRLCGDISGFPTTAADLVVTAESLGYSQDLTNFVNLFSNSMVFEDQKAFLDECEVLERMIQQELESPPEILKTP